MSGSDSAQARISPIQTMLARAASKLDMPPGLLEHRVKPLRLVTQTRSDIHSHRAGGIAGDSVRQVAIPWTIAWHAAKGRAKAGVDQGPNRLAERKVDGDARNDAIGEALNRSGG